MPSEFHLKILKRVIWQKSAKGSSKTLGVGPAAL